MAIHALALCLLAAGASAAEPGPRKVTVVVERRDAAMLDKLAAAAQGRAVLSVHELAPSALDPIEKGKLVALLQSRDLIVAVGDGATEFVMRELEDTPVYFVGAGLVRGEDLSSPQVSGLFSYSVESLLDAVQAMLPGTLGLA